MDDHAAVGSLGPDHHRTEPVHTEAIERLMASADHCLGRDTHAVDLLDMGVAARAARAFKLDVSFDLSGPRRARFSVNDKGEPERFRQRVAPVLESLGLPRAISERFFAISPPGEVQTTVAVKWGAGERPDRVSLYFEELARAADYQRIRSAVFGLGGLAAPPLHAAAEPVAVCVDYSNGEAVGLKTYDAHLERPGTCDRSRVPQGLVESIDELPPHPHLGTVRYMIASRYRPHGLLIGHKLLWMTEVHRREYCTWAWTQVDRWRARFAARAHPAVAGALDALRTEQSLGNAAYAYPDLVCLNVGREGGPPELIVYVSIR